MNRESGGRLNLISKVIILVCLGVFICSGALIICYLIGAAGADSDFRKLKENGTAMANSDTEESVDLEKLCVRNQDIIGWLTVDGTRIDYPVMKTISDNEYYLHRDFSGSYSESGTPFMDAESSPESLNWLIYGHNMKIGTMFHDLLKFNDKDFWAGHRTFSFTRFKDDDNSSRTGFRRQVTEQYEILAAGYSQINSNEAEDFRYYAYTSIKSADDFEKYLKGIKAISCYDTGIKADYGDHLITLSTCAYHVKNGRFFIVGVRT